MIRIIAFLGGLGFVAALLVAALMPREAAEKSVSEQFHKEPKEVSFTTDGPLGKFDHAQLQRGFQVYKEVCSACHSLRLVSFGDLTGIGYTPGQVKTIAAEWTQEQPSINPDTGEAATVGIHLRVDLGGDFPLCQLFGRSLGRLRGGVQQRGDGDEREDG